MKKNTTVPAALANTADAELEAFRTYVEGEEGSLHLGNVEGDLSDLEQSIRSLLDADFEDGATGAISEIDEAIGFVDSLGYNLRSVREGYVDQLGIPAALKEIVQALQQKVTKPHVDALRYGLESMWNSDRKLARDIREGLMTLGMPKEYRGMASNSFRRAMLGDWLRQLDEAVAALPDHLKSEAA